MSRSVYLEGKTQGIAVANLNEEKIRSSKKAELGNIAGCLMDAIAANEEAIIHHTFARTENWRTGFFDGFMERADEIRNKDKL